MTRKRNPLIRARMKLLERFHITSITLVVLPGFYAVAMIFGLPAGIRLSLTSPSAYYFHVVFGTYCFINIAGNLLLSYLTDSRLKNYDGPGPYCEYCKQNRIADAWHCMSCNACIIRRDHHCCFLSHCIGRKNIRYFIYMMGHIVFTMPYVLYYNTLYIFTQLDFSKFLQCIMVLTKPYVFAFFSDPPNFENILFVISWLIELALLPSAMIFLFLHLRNVIRGVTAHEFDHGKAPNNAHWTRNMEYSFGTRWQLAFLWPFVDSPLPDFHYL